MKMRIREKVKSTFCDLDIGALFLLYPYVL